VIIDGDVEKLPTGAASFVLGIAGDAMAGLVNPGEFLDVDVQQVTGSGMFVAHDRNSGFEHADFVQPQSVKMRLTVARLKPVAWAMRTPVQRRRRKTATCSDRSGPLRRGERCGRELRSHSPSRPA
jgi:hypothetical protein